MIEQFWSVGTALRNPNRAVRCLDIIDTFSGMPWTEDIQLDYYIERMDCQPLFVQKLFRQNSVTIIHGRQVI